MKNVVTLIVSLLLVGITGSKAAESVSEEMGNYRIDGSRYIFVEGTVEFSVFPDGQFDFVYVGPQGGSNVNVHVNTPNVNISFNSGYDYEAYVQYDDYGAVIQVEEVPIYYDAYGRIIQAGNTEIHYNGRRIVRVGGLRVFYNHYGHFSHYTGFINVWTPRYIFRPWHVYYVRPVFAGCVVYDYPYRLYYNPYRYTWHQHREFYRNRHRVAYNNGRRNFYRPGSRVHHKDGRVAVNRNYNPNRRNTAVAYQGRSSNEIGSRSRVTNERASRNHQSASRATTAKRSAKRDGQATVDRGTRINKRESVQRTSRTAERSGNRTYRNTSAKRDYGKVREPRTAQKVRRSEKSVARAQRPSQQREARQAQPNRRNSMRSATHRPSKVMRSAPRTSKRSTAARSAQGQGTSKALMNKSSRTKQSSRRGRGN